MHYNFLYNHQCDTERNLSAAQINQTKKNLKDNLYYYLRYLLWALCVCFIESLISISSSVGEKKGSFCHYNMFINMWKKIAMQCICK